MDALLTNWNLHVDFKRALQASQAVIAGSAVVHAFLSQQTATSLSWEPNDIDVWIPWSPLGRGHYITNFIAVLDNSGYQITSFIPTDHDTYGRLKSWVKVIIGFKMNIDDGTTRKIQLLLLHTEIANFDARLLVENFDLEITQMWYPNDVQHDINTWTIKATQAAVHAAETRKVSITTSSVEVYNQKFHEWVRTISRVLKYERRGFVFDIASHIPYFTMIFQRFFCLQTSSSSNVLNQIKNWNQTLNLQSSYSHATSSVPMMLLCIPPVSCFTSSSFGTAFVIYQPFQPHRFVLQIAWEQVSPLTQRNVAWENLRYIEGKIDSYSAEQQLLQEESIESKQSTCTINDQTTQTTQKKQDCCGLCSMIVVPIAHKSPKRLVYSELLVGSLITVFMNPYSLKRATMYLAQNPTENIMLRYDTRSEVYMIGSTFSRLFTINLNQPQSVCSSFVFTGEKCNPHSDGDCCCYLEQKSEDGDVYHVKLVTIAITDNFNIRILEKNWQFLRDHCSPVTKWFTIRDITELYDYSQLYNVFSITPKKQ